MKVKSTRLGLIYRLKGVTKSFGDFHVLKSVSFSVNPGETLCILGRSGVGKSVSLQMLPGVFEAG